MTLYLHNTLAREKQEFKPIDPHNVRIYLCGPTVYDFAHIGNARPAVVFDVLVRLLRHIYGPKHVTFARNITDIEDKIMKKAADQGVSIDVITKKFTDIYNEDMAGLRVLPPDIEPKATEHLDEMIAMMGTLLASHHAYEAEGHVLFDTSSMADYGKLSRHDQDELKAGARVEVAPYKKNPTDFVMWKPSADDQPGWDSPWGRGRPGWHLECSCMIKRHLGTTIDIHCGGLDLIFPHHENEIAQSECTHNAPFVNYWLHNGYVTMSGEKMSKSLGNVRTIHELLDRFPGEALRLTLLSAHYRQPLDFNGDIVMEQKKRLDRWYRQTDGVEAGEVSARALEALKDDLNTPKVLALLEDEDPAVLKATAQFLGLLTHTSEEWFQGERGESSLSSEKIEALINERLLARSNKDFKRSDEIRDELKAAGILLEDGAGGTTWRRED